MKTNGMNFYFKRKNRSEPSNIPVFILFRITNSRDFTPTNINWHEVVYDGGEKFASERIHVKIVNSFEIIYLNRAHV